MLWNTTGVTDGVYQLHVVVLDVAGNTTTSAAVPNVRIDNTVPTTSQNDPGQYLRATKTLTGSAADVGSGIDHVDFQRAPTGGGSWTTIATDSTPLDGFQASFDTTSVSDGHYDFRTVAYDVAGNQAAAAPVTDRLVDNTVPTATINSPGPYLRGAVNLDVCHRRSGRLERVRCHDDRLRVLDERRRHAGSRPVPTSTRAPFPTATSTCTSSSRMRPVTPRPQRRSRASQTTRSLQRQTTLRAAGSPTRSP